MPYKRRKRSVWSIIRTVPDIAKGWADDPEKCHGMGAEKGLYLKYRRSYLKQNGKEARL